MANKRKRHQRKPKDLYLCPLCEGAGQYHEFDGRTGGYKTEWCWVCQGQGEVDADTIRALQDDYHGPDPQPGY